MHATEPLTSPLPEAGPQLADVCIIIEGAYPYVHGGVSSWTHDLITTQSHLTFHVVVIVAPGAETTPRYKMPPNVCGLTNVYLTAMPHGAARVPGGDATLRELHALARRVMVEGDPDALLAMVRATMPLRSALGRDLLLDSRVAFKAFGELYEAYCAGASYLNAFWGWRTLLGGLFSALLSDLPPARCYHSISTGYAGLFAARAAVETGRPALVTEHGVYTNERRLEILAADWLAVDDSGALTVEGDHNKVKDFWIRTFVSYSKACYRCCEKVITLFEGNHSLQIEDGAPIERLSVIPNGIDPKRFGSATRVPSRAEGGDRPPTIAFAGRVVPIKDVKTFLRACALLVKRVPDVICYVLGPTDEDAVYAAECRALVDQLGIAANVHFAGMVNLVDFFGKVDVVLLTSISESQPLVILEAGAAGIPTVATDVGACRELIEGRSDEVPNLGMGGRVCAIGNPSAIANAVAELLLDEPLRRACGDAILRRVLASYDKATLHLRYAALYHEMTTMPDTAWTAR